ncbi:MAG: hypothetical protein WD533_02860, partial [Dehalococcoidia bacterium]
PGWYQELRIALKRPVRNLLYGEHDAAMGRERVSYELDRYREWLRAGMSVPRLVETPLRNVRIIEGLPYPTLYTLLNDVNVSQERKLHAVRVGLRALVHQHHVAQAWGSKGLVHREPGPWNMLVDLSNEAVYWYDLEQPADSPGMSMEDMKVRGLRMFVVGVLEYLPDQLDEVLAIVVQEYPDQALLRRLAESLLKSVRSLPQRVAQRLGLRKGRVARQRLIALRLLALVGDGAGEAGRVRSAIRGAGDAADSTRNAA